MAMATRHDPLLGLPQLALPPLVAAVADRLSRQPVRQPTDAIAGSPLYIQRLGASVLPHLAVTGGWLCTIVAVDKPGPLPVGVCTVPDLDLRTAFNSVEPSAPHSSLSADEYLDLWQVRVSQAFHGRPGLLETALVNAADRETLQVITHHGDKPAHQLISQTRLHPTSGIQNGINRLRNAGFLIDATVPTEITSDPAGGGEQRSAFVIPPTSWGA
jgi:hypothetical protein